VNRSIVTTDTMVDVSLMLLLASGIRDPSLRSALSGSAVTIHTRRLLMKIKSQKDFFSGLLFVGVGITFASGATTYKVGIADNMGPGYFPLLLGILMIILGIAITLKALVLETEDGDKIGRWAWKPLAAVLGANLAFGVLLGGLPGIGLPALGMIVGIYALTIIASLASKHFNLRQVFILATILAAVSYLTFIILLKGQILVWPALITG
jgi:hypothetical protein